MLLLELINEKTRLDNEMSNTLDLIKYNKLDIVRVMSNLLTKIGHNFNFMYTQDNTLCFNVLALEIHDIIKIPFALLQNEEEFLKETERQILEFIKQMKKLPIPLTTRDIKYLLKNKKIKKQVKHRFELCEIYWVPEIYSRWPVWYPPCPWNTPNSKPYPYDPDYCLIFKADCIEEIKKDIEEVHKKEKSQRVLDYWYPAKEMEIQESRIKIVVETIKHYMSPKIFKTFVTFDLLENQ